MKLTKTLTILFVSFFSLQIAGAQTTKFTGSLLWKISGKGLKAPSYVFGTHHLISSDFLESIPHFWDILNSTEQTIGEMDMSDMPQMQAKMMQVAMLPEGMSYKEMLSTEEYSALDEGLKKLFGVGLEQFGQFHPALISSMTAIQMYAKYFPEIHSKDHVAVDVLVQNVAVEKGKTVIGFETAEEQLDILFNSEPIKVQVQALVCSFRNFDLAIDEQTVSLFQNYREGELNKMYTLSFNTDENPCPVPATFQNALLKNRNDNWLKKLPKIMKDKSSFIAVGALHLAGEEGLLFQLDKMGYTVEAVK